MEPKDNENGMNENQMREMFAGIFRNLMIQRLIELAPKDKDDNAVAGVAVIKDFGAFYVFLN